MSLVPLKSEYDAIVIGGGVNGCGVARDLALRGVKTLLVDKGDFSMGTSWASSGMIHGGLRYLLSDIQTTKKSCTDAGFIRRIAPHLIFRIPLFMPVLKQEKLKGRINLDGADAMFTLYDRYQPLKGGLPHVRLTAAEMLRMEPLIDADIIGAVGTDEWGIDVPRLCTINAIDAAEHGADIRTWTAVTGMLMDGHHVVGVQLTDTLTDERFEVRSRVVVNCAGPWAPKVAAMAGAEVKLRPGKGVHLILDRRISNIGIICTALDGRQVFIIPHENTSLIGTTDDDYFGDPDDIRVLEDEIEYLLEAVASVIPIVRKARIIKTIAGLRPTLYEHSKYEDDLTRDHRVFDHSKKDGVEGLITLGGGKLAAYRIMAEDTANLVCQRLGNISQSTTHAKPLPGGDSVPDADELAAEYDLDPYAVRRLIFRQGSRAIQILDRIREDRTLSYYVCQCEPVMEAEIRYCIENELVRRAVDLMGRCRIGEGPCQGYGCLVQVATIFGDMRNLHPDEVAQEAVHFVQEKWRWRRDILSGPHMAGEELYRMVHMAVLNPLAILKNRKEVY